jgi:hypothetical protein
MRSRPELAAEVLLAVLINDSPEEDYSSSVPREDVGLEYDSDSYPTAYWKSPFFQFLSLAPAVALHALVRLVNFCTEQWTAGYVRWTEGPPPAQVIIVGGYEKPFVGEQYSLRLVDVEFNIVGSITLRSCRAGKVALRAGRA